MSGRIFVLCLLSSIITTEASLKCQTCFSSKEECKNEDMELVECAPDEIYCFTLSFSSTMFPQLVSFTTKGCATANQCSEGDYGITSLTKKYQQMRIACCDTDGCNTAPLPIPERNLLKPNGFFCEGNYKENGYSEESGFVLCLGDEDQCFSAEFETSALSIYHSSVTAQGCTTKKTCSYPLGNSEQGKGLLHFNIEKVECWDPLKMEGWNGFSKTFGTDGIKGSIQRAVRI